ncbi:alpha/beta hydrolase [Phycicoccus endophyticus]|nr:alpha/beta hydrolase [Phycicoccus endophyticus]
MRGRYLDLGGQRVYCEEGGEGPVPVLCLHTAGADSRQFRHLLEDAELGARFRFIAFDLPWHGRSDPPTDWQERTYRLTTTDYAEVIRAVSGALGLERPVLLGCSMGGAIVLYMAAVHGEEFRACLSLEGGLGNPSRFVEWTNHLEVDHSHFLTSWVGGLVAPSSPAAARAQTLWGYAQSGPGVYQGDTYFYSEDFPAIAAGLGRATCPLWVFNGEYDYSATSAMSREAADALGGTYVDMPGCGHFPMSEDPVRFRDYLLPVLEQVEEAGS